MWQAVVRTETPRVSVTIQLGVLGREERDLGDDVLEYLGTYDSMTFGAITFLTVATVSPVLLVTGDCCTPVELSLACLPARGDERHGDASHAGDYAADDGD